MLVTRPLTLEPIGYFSRHHFQRILVELLHAERVAVGLGIDADDLHFHGLDDMQNVGGVMTRFQAMSLT